MPLKDKWLLKFLSDFNDAVLTKVSKGKNIADTACGQLSQL